MAETAGTVAFGLLGPLSVVVEGCALRTRDVGGRRRKQLLEILLVHDGQPVAKGRIADLLWGEQLPKDWVRTLEAHVSILRSRLTSDAALARRLVVTAPGGYRVATELATVDIHRFDDLTSRATQRPLGERGPLLEDALGWVRCELLADEPYAEWTFALRRLYHERHIGALLDLADEYLFAGDAPAAAARAAEVIATEPTRERAHRLLMLARYAAGDQGAALRAYEQCRTGLAASLGIEPLPETESLRAAIVRHEPPGLLLPAPPAAVVGGGRRGRTRYVKAGSTSIAYQVFGAGPPDLVLIQGFVTNVEVCWEWPAYAAFLHELGSIARVTLFDKRGTGMSDPVDRLYELAERTADVTAVMDAAGCDRAVLFGISEGAALAVQFAVELPERVAGLVLYGSFARALEGDEGPGAWSQQRKERFLDGIEAGWATGYAAEVAHPSAASDERLREWIARYLRLSASPSMARDLMRMNAELDITALLGEVQAPALVVHRAEERWGPPDAGRAVADGIPGARFELVPGADHWPWVGDHGPIIDLAKRFIDGLAHEM